MAKNDVRSAKTSGAQKTGGGDRAGARSGDQAQGRMATNAIPIDVGPAILVVSYLRDKLEEARRTASETETIDRMLDVANTFIDIWDCQSKTMTRVF